MDAKTKRKPGSVVLIVGASALVAIIVGVALLGSPKVAEYEPGSPEAAAQRYVQALLDDDYTTAHSLLDADWQRECDPHDLRIEPWWSVATATFTDVNRRGDTATIDIRLDTGDLDFEDIPIQADTIDTVLVLEHQAGEWRIVGADWPLSECIGR